MAFNVEELQAVYGLTQMSKAKKALSRIAKWNPEFRSGESIFQEATSKTPSGFSAQEKAAYNNDLARQATQRYRLASQSNPNMSANIQAGIGYGSLAALNNFAKNDAALKQQKIGQLAGAITAQDNANVNYQMNQKSQMEQAYGEAYKAGLSNVVGAIKSKENDLKSVASFMIPGAGAAGGAGGGVSAQGLGSLVGGRTLNGINQGTGTVGGMGAMGGNVVGDIPYNTNWKPYATPEPINPFKPYSMTTNDWITNPNQFRP